MPHNRETISQERTDDPRQETDARVALEQYADAARNDSVFQEIYLSLAEKWDELDENTRRHLLSLLSEVVDAIKSYQGANRKLELVVRDKNSQTKIAQENIERADQGRRMAHNTLIDSLNILSREMKKHSVENSWRGLKNSNEEIGAWALQLQL